MNNLAQDIIDQIVAGVPKLPRERITREIFGRVTPVEHSHERVREAYRSGAIEEARRDWMQLAQDQANVSGDLGDVQRMNYWLEKRRQIQFATDDELAWIIGQIR